MSDLNKNYYEKITFRDALRLAIHDSMQEDEKIIVIAANINEKVILFCLILFI